MRLKPFPQVVGRTVVDAVVVDNDIYEISIQLTLDDGSVLVVNPWYESGQTALDIELTYGPG